MGFPPLLEDVGLWVAVTAIILLVTSELLAPYSDYFGDFVIDKTRIRLAALILGATFMVYVLLRVIIP